MVSNWTPGLAFIFSGFRLPDEEGGGWCQWRCQITINILTLHDLQETKGRRQWRSPQQPEVAEQPQEQVGGRTEAGNTGEVAHQVQEVQVGRHGRGGGERQPPGGLLAAQPELPLRQPRGRHRDVQHQPLRGPHYRLWR